ncbi:MAG: hypothetical protein FJW27_14720 [Acidimicrobiia bacterium]|nr:hypothetical protein [Acidimicrobiia bacterium]
MRAGALRRVLAALFLFGSVGTAIDLALLEHVDGAWQQVPLALIGIACVSLVVLAIRPSAMCRRLFQITMVAFVASGLAGIALHYQGNVEFELELQPDLSGFSLVWEALKGATPALAPGVMILLGALGLTYTSAENTRAAD